MQIDVCLNDHANLAVGVLDFDLIENFPGRKGDVLGMI